MKKRFIAIIMILISSFCITPAYAVETDWYTIQSSNSQLYRINTESTKAGAELTIRPANTRPDQKYYIRNNGNGTYTIATAISGGTKNVSANAYQQNRDTNNKKQQWKIEENADNTVSFVNVDTGKYLTFNGIGKKIEEKDKNNTKNQKFTLTKVNVTYTVTFDDGMGHKNYIKVKKGETAKAPKNPTRTGYIFKGWDKELNNIQSNLVINAIWEPNTYTVTFTDGQGNTLKRENVAQGKSATAPANPTRNGYKFAGWDKDIKNISSNLTVNATWTKEDVHTVTFTDGNGKTLKTESVKKGSNATAPANPTKEGYIFVGWDKEYNNITGNITVNAKWNINKYTVKFSDGEKVLSTQTIEYGKNATAPANPTKTGYSFDGWDKSYNNIKSNITITAKWIKTSYFTVIFTDGQGKTLKTESVEAGKKATAPSIPSRPGYTFSGWDKSFDRVTGNLTINAKWIADTFQVVFTDGVSTTLKTEKVEYGKKATAPTNPTRTGYIFAGWDKTFDKITANTTVNAKWTANKYTVKFTDGLGKTLSTQAVEYGKAATAPKTPTRNGYTFTGWNKTFNKVTGNLTIDATWKINKYTVTFKDGTKTEKTESVEYGKAATAPTLTKAGYTLSWDKDFKKITGNLTVNTVWLINKYTVKFMSDNKAISTQTVEYGKSATTPTNPTKTGYTFDGWDKIFNKITANTTINAKWKINTYTVTFKDGGIPIKTEMIEYGKPATAPSVKKEGYTLGWDKAFNNVTSNLTINTKWTINKYNITFNGNGSTKGSIAAINSKDYHSSIKLPSNTFEKTGYSFTGWNISANGSGQGYVNGATLTVPAKNITLYAQWKINTYTVIFTDGNGKTLSTQKVEYGKAAKAPTNPTKVGHTFSGWDKTFDKITGDITITAKWTPIKYTVTFKDNYLGIVRSTQLVEYGKAATAPTFHVNENKILKGWDKSFDKITSDLTVTTVYEDKIPVIFFGNNQEVLKLEYVEKGKSATPPTTPTRTGYIFAGWDGSYTNVTEKKTVTAKWTPKQVTVTFNNNIASDTKTWNEVYKYGTLGQKFGQNLKTTGDFGSWKRTGYQLSGWSFDKNATKATYSLFSGVSDSWINTNAGKVTLYAVWQPAKYTVTFVDGFGKTLKTQTVNRWSAATAPTTPTRTGYKFLGWDNTFTDIKNNLTVTAMWEPVLTVGNTNSATFATGTMNLNASIGNNAKLTYTSSNTNILTVDSSGKITGKANGTANVTIKAATGQTITKSITVFALSTLAEGWYQFKTGTSSMDIPSSKNTAGLQVQIYATNTSNAQKFKIKKSGSIYYIYTANNLALESSGGKIIQKASNTASKYQQWKIIQYGTFKTFYNVGSGKFINLSGTKLVDGDKLAGAIFTANATTDPSFGAPPTGWVEIAPKNNTGVRFDVANNDAHSDTNIGLWTKNGNNAQRYYISGIGSGKYKIATGSTFRNRYLTAVTGNNVKQMDASDSTYQQWYIYKTIDGGYEFKNVATNMCIDIPSGNAKAGANVQTYADNDSNAQRFYIYSSSAPTGSKYYPITYKRKWNNIVRDNLSDIQKTVFDEALKNLNTDNTALEVGKGKISSDTDAKRIINALNNQYYYQAVYYTDGTKVGTKITDCYRYNSTNKSIIINAKKCKDTFQKTKAIENLVQSVSKQIFKSGMTERQAVEAANRWIINNIKYKVHHDLYYIVTKKEAECDGYSRFFELLMDVAGVDCKYVSGYATSQNGHGWNYVNVEDTWYYIDVTWNDNSPQNQYYLTTKLWADHKENYKTGWY